VAVNVFGGGQHKLPQNKTVQCKIKKKRQKDKPMKTLSKTI
jgi:hypothetical protein